MTHPDRVAGHPLTGVPEDVLLVAREAVGAFDETDSWDDDVVRELGDAVVANLTSRGYVTWPGRAPDRESLVIAVMFAQAWQSNEDGRTVSEYLVDTVVLPLIAGIVGPSRTVPATGTVVNRVDGSVTGTLVQGDRFGDVTIAGGGR